MLADLLKWFLCAWARPIQLIHAQHCLLVIAPHPDDETLGCAATIVHARRNGIPVYVAVVTDGSGHPSDVDKLEVARVRRLETLAACHVLGVSDSHVVFMEFPDGGASTYKEHIFNRLLILIRELDPDCIFAPCGIDNHADHQAIAAVVGSLISLDLVRGRVYSYPVWFWYPRFLILAFLTGHFLRIRRMPIGIFGDQKKRALACYSTQTLRSSSGEAILTPQFLRHFLGSYEYFFEQWPGSAHG
jgi:LmbE family N-acetylglucosaminyl deacetylase